MEFIGISIFDVLTIFLIKPRLKLNKNISYKYIKKTPSSHLKRAKTIQLFIITYCNFKSQAYFTDNT